MLLDAFLLALIIGLLTGGRLSNLKDLELHGLGLFFAAALLRVSVLAFGAADAAFMSKLGPGLIVVSYLLLLAALWRNRHLRPLRLVTLGVFLNFLVIAANGGSMPGDRALAVRAGNTEMVRLLDSPNYIIHKPITPHTRLRFLADVLPLPYLYPRPKWFCPGSLGDIFITFGVCATLLGGMRRGKGKDGPVAP